MEKKAAFEWENVIYAVLILLLIGFIVIGIVYYTDKPLLNQLLGIDVGGESYDSSLGITPFEQFANEYKLCKAIPDTDCLCPFTAFTLPKNSFIEIENQGSTTSFNYYEGDIKSIENAKLLQGCKPNPNSKEEQKGCDKSSDFVVENDQILVPYSVPGNLYSYLKDGRFDTSEYRQDTKIFIAPFETEINFEHTKRMSFEVPWSPMQVYTTADISYSNEFNLYTLYKEGNSVYLVPNSNSGIALPFYNPDKKNLDELKATVKQCKAPDGFEQAIQTFDNLKKAISICSKKVFTPVSCRSVKFDMPDKFALNIYKNSIELTYNSQPIVTSQNINLAYLPNPLKSSEIITDIPSIQQKPGKDTLSVDFYSCPNNLVCFTYQIVGQQKPGSFQRDIAKTIAEQYSANA